MVRLLPLPIFQGHRVRAELYSMRLWHRHFGVSLFDSNLAGVCNGWVKIRFLARFRL
jgi:hypothetical protein